MTDQATPQRSSSALLSALPAVVGVVVALVAAIIQYAAIDGGQTRKLTGIDQFLGLPSAGASVVFFSLFVAWFIGVTAGATYTHRLSVGAIVVASLGTLFQLAVVIGGFSWVGVLLLAAAVFVLLFAIAGCRASERAGIVPQIAAVDRPKIFGVVLVIAGLAGLTAAWNLSVDKVTVILSPGASLNCNVSLLVECGKNLGSWQGSLLGFPNPLLGLGGFAVVLMVGIAVLAGVRFSRWWWIAFNAGVFLAFAFITFLIISSVYFIGTLCLWCALVWTVTIPTFWLTTIRNLKEGHLRVNARATRFWASAYTWLPLITLVCYLAILGIYQARLDLFNSL
ncbi:MAG TPA: vitamin K epoxide reductase family protein [Galbitalea sp.]